MVFLSVILCSYLFLKLLKLQTIKDFLCSIYLFTLFRLSLCISYRLCIALYKGKYERPKKYFLGFW